MPASLDREPFSEEFLNHGQKEIGFWSSESLPVHDVMKQLIVSRSRPVAKFQTAIAKPHETLESHQSHLLNEQNGILGLQQLMGSEKKSDISVSPWRSTNYNIGFSNLNKLSTPPNAGLGVLQENSLFSNSVPETFNQKVILPTRDVFFPRQSQETSSNFNGEEPFETLEEIEARTIGNLLPHEDDLFTGIDELGSFPLSNNHDDADDEIFRMELDDGLGSNRGSKRNNIICSGPCMVGPNGACSGEHSHRELPSRTLFVRNINSSVEDDELKLIFEKYGDIRMLYTACKHRGFVMVSYYDIRSASNALKQLQDKPLRRRKLDIHYSIPKDNSPENDTNQGMVAISNLDPSVTNDDIHRIFSVCGEIKEISESPEKNRQKVMEFYDSRAAEAALHVLDGTVIAGKQIKLEPTCPQFTTQCALMQQFSYDPEQEEVGIWQQGSPPNGLGLCLGRTRAQTVTVNGMNIAMLNQHKDSRETLGLPANRVSPSFPHFLPPRSPYVGDHGNQPGVASIEGSLGKMNLSFQRSPNIHSHSLPEHPNGLSPGIFRNSLGIMSPMDANIARLHEGAESRHVNNGGLSYNHALGAPGNGVCSVHGHQYARNRYPPYHPPPHSGNMLWQNSPPFVNNIVARSPSQLHGFSRTPPHMLNNPVPFHHHVGSAPATNAPLWERHHGYTSDLMEGSPLHPASLGSMGFSASPTMHPMEFASRNIFPFAEGNCMDPPLSAPLIGIPSPQQSCQMFGGQNPMIHFNARYGAAGERMRSRRTDSSTTQGDNRKQYELDIERIMRGEDNRTTLMIKNIPNKYTSKMLLATIDEHHRGTYDFIYLPIDFKNKCNVGYAFINLVDPKHIVPFYETFNGKKWEKFNSEKVASLAYARIQGKAALVAHFQNSSLMNEDKRCRPILFHSDGPNAGDQEPFPMGASTRSRPGRPRSQNSDDDHQQGSPPSTLGGEDTANGSDLSPASKESSES